MQLRWPQTVITAGLVLSACAREVVFPPAPTDKSVSMSMSMSMSMSRNKASAPTSNLSAPEGRSAVSSAADDPKGQAGTGAAASRATPAADEDGNDSGPASAGSPALAPQVEIVPPNGEVCDRLDNDDNGLVDDADVEADGVCDCLKIASIGRPGAYGEGDLQFRTWPNAMAQNHVVALENAELTPERLASVDVLIVLNVSTFVDVPGETAHHPFTDAEVEAFESWVRAGGGVFTTAGYSGEIDKEVVNVNKLLAPFELGYSPTKYGLNGIISNWTSHPVTEGVQRVYTEVGAEPDGPAALTLARDATDHVALQVPMTDPARILVWGDEWITYASQWQVEADQQVERFWVNALTWLSRESSCQHKL